MQNTNFQSLTRWAGVFFSLIGVAAASPVEIVGTLRNANGDPLSGRISIFREVPHLVANYYPVDKTGIFKIASDSQGGLVIHASAERHASAESIIPSGVSGIVSLNIVLPLARDIQGRVVDSLGSGVPAAAVRVRYHEPGKPVRHVSFDEEEQRTDGDGRFLIRDVGINVPFVVDVLAPEYVPTSSRQLRLAAGDVKVDEIVIALDKRGASIVVQVVDKEDRAIGDAAVTLLADPAGLGAKAQGSWLHLVSDHEYDSVFSGLGAKAQGSWLHPRAFRQQGVTSRLGNVRFRGVPPGRIIVRVKTADSAVEQRAVVSGGQELRLTLRIL